MSNLNPILQFGTSRFLQAHADLFVSEAAKAGEALGHITIVQTTGSAQGAARVAAFRQAGGYPVRIRGWQDGAQIDEERRADAVTQAWQAGSDWRQVRDAAVAARVIVSNTGDTGYQLADSDHAGMLDGATVPASFPAKLLVLLHDRFLAGAAPISIFPCELVADNGHVLRQVIVALARQWGGDAAFIVYLQTGCLWINSLVDRIVSEAIEPIGAVAEPYALWAIEAQEGMLLPCLHPQLVVTGSLREYEQRKLFLLNLGHTYLAQLWMERGSPAGMTVREAMDDGAMRAALEALWHEEVLPVFAAMGAQHSDAALAYVAQVRERFSNPFLAHRLADIAQHHAGKIERRMAPVAAQARQLCPALAQPRLRAMLAPGAQP
ncbi:mannitol dehydrogenase family protein [Janthinobacterium rivuli]|uniref:Mannitol dehydrogenase family protein n=1 Tax=Janthinobacterium rivuli TaxID=2751478 RepID=A0ABY8IAZ2_9BURK|nr:MULTISPECIES: mannitol dehydrogenase family protein [Janthinobacterium]NVI84845.1 mannitol dehydrogenase family protein [Janthinobacterium sp. BJB401]WFR81037.1 mannitol dehydrogenase family protein [Janthinobacterium rivuli]